MIEAWASSPRFGSKLFEFLFLRFWLVFVVVLWSWHCRLPGPARSPHFLTRHQTLRVFTSGWISWCSFLLRLYCFSFRAGFDGGIRGHTFGASGWKVKQNPKDTHFILAQSYSLLGIFLSFELSSRKIRTCGNCMFGKFNRKSWMRFFSFYCVFLPFIFVAKIEMFGFGRFDLNQKSLFER